MCVAHTMAMCGLTVPRSPSSNAASSFASSSIIGRPSGSLLLSSTGRGDSAVCSVQYSWGPSRSGGGFYERITPRPVMIRVPMTRLIRSSSGTDHATLWCGIRL